MPVTAPTAEDLAVDLARDLESLERTVAGLNVARMPAIAGVLASHRRALHAEARLAELGPQVELLTEDLARTRRQLVDLQAIRTVQSEAWRAFVDPEAERLRADLERALARLRRMEAGCLQVCRHLEEDGHLAWAAALRRDCEVGFEGITEGGETGS